MITVYFKNEVVAHLASATKVEYRAHMRWADSSPGTQGGAAPEPLLVCLNAEGQQVGAFLLREIVGWDSEEWEEDDEDD
jgi:hypothetical protein